MLAVIPMIYKTKEIHQMQCDQDETGKLKHLSHVGLFLANIGNITCKNFNW